MADYGHELVFGTFLTPRNGEPQAPVALARLSERAGLDLVTSTGMISDTQPWGDLQEVFYELKAPTDRNQQGMDLVRCVNRNLLAVTT